MVPVVVETVVVDTVVVVVDEVDVAVDVVVVEAVMVCEQPKSNRDTSARTKIAVVFISFNLSLFSLA